MSTDTNAIFPPGDRAPADYFTGNVWVKMLLPNDSTLNCQVGNVTFEPSARNHWHKHPGGQILIVTHGIGYYQEKGKAVQIVHKGDVIKCTPGVAHWHGATPDSTFAYIAVSPTPKGETKWLERVTDEEYRSANAGQSKNDKK